jgi:low affinity Fe/Cu permease
MPMAVLFWVLMLIWLIFGVLSNAPGWNLPYSGWVSVLLIFVLFALLGWHDFGAAVK